MIEEREINASGLLDALAHLDPDEGIRIVDNCGCVSFVTRGINEYTLNICRDSDEKWEYARTAEEVYEILCRYVKEPFKVWLY